MYLAAYGTLQNRFGRWGQLGMENNCRVVGRVKLQGKLYQQRWFPMLLESDNPDDLVDAELIEVVTNKESVLSNLDYFEGHPTYFKRKVVNVDKKDIVVYFWPHGVQDGFLRINQFNG